MKDREMKLIAQNYGVSLSTVKNRLKDGWNPLKKFPGLYQAPRKGKKKVSDPVSLALRNWVRAK